MSASAATQIDLRSITGQSFQILIEIYAFRRRHDHVEFIFFASVIWLIYKAISKFAPNTSHAKSIVGKETPREILDRRLAAGEISSEEYQATRKLLE